MITDGPSPGSAASKAIDKLNLDSNKASIVLIPPEKASSPWFELNKDRLLNEDEARMLLLVLDIPAIAS